MVDHVAGFTHREVRIDRHHDCAKLRQSKKNDNVGVLISCHDPESVSLFDPLFFKQVAGFVDIVMKLLPGVGLARIDTKQFLRIFFKSTAQCIAEGEVIFPVKS